jgi:hypothetical protein
MLRRALNEDTAVLNTNYRIGHIPAEMLQPILMLG